MHDVRSVCTLYRYAKRGVKFEWDGRNVGHIALHNVTPNEVEQVIANDPISLEVVIRKGERRTVCAGRTDSGSELKVVYTCATAGFEW